MASGVDGAPSGGVVKEGWLQKRGEPTSETREEWGRRCVSELVGGVAVDPSDLAR